MKIAGHRSDRRWARLKAQLQANPSRKLWESAYQNFYLKRIETRYLNPIRAIGKSDTESGEGFSIVALLCTLVEFLESCERGFNFHFVGRTGYRLQQYEYSESTASTYFRDFLRNRAPFSQEFPANLIDGFYRDVRCGLLHEARTKGGWMISTRSSKALVHQKRTSIVLYRHRLLACFEQYFQDYRHRLLMVQATQEALIRKFDFLCLP